MKSGFTESTAVWRMACCLLVLVSASGCRQSSGPNRLEVHGKVVQDGKPLETGTISFLPAEGVTGPAASTLIEKGIYKFTKDDGPVAGAHKVLINVTPVQQSKLTGQPAKPAGKTEWTFAADVGKGPLEQDFKLD